MYIALEHSLTCKEHTLFVRKDLNSTHTKELEGMLDGEDYYQREVQVVRHLELHVRMDKIKVQRMELQCRVEELELKRKEYDLTTKQTCEKTTDIGAT